MILKLIKIVPMCGEDHKTNKFTNSDIILLKTLEFKTHMVKHD